MQRTHQVHVCWIVVVLASAHLVPLATASNLRVELSLAAEDLTKAIRGAGEDSVAIGQFTGPPQLPVQAGPGIVTILADELQKQGIAVKPQAKLGIEGKFRDVIDAETNMLAAEISGQLVQRRGAVLYEFKRGVFGDATLPSLFGITATLPPEMGNNQRDKRMLDRLDNPRVHLIGNRISSEASSPYGIEILVKDGDEYVVRAPHVDCGLAYVPIARDETYAVRLINDSPYEAAVMLTIDGLSMFAFSENRNYTQVIIRPETSFLVKGWHRSNTDSELFLVTEYSTGAAAELNLGGSNLGVITACFSAAWDADDDRPSDEPENPNKFARSADATGRGPQFEEKYVEVTRHFGVVRETISVRYSK